MALIKSKKPEKVKFTIPVSKDLYDELQAEIAKLPKDVELDFDDYVKKMIKELKQVNSSQS